LAVAVAAEKKEEKKEEEMKKEGKKVVKEGKAVKVWGRAVELEEMSLSEVKRRIWAAMPPSRVALSHRSHTAQYGSSDDFGWPPSVDTLSAEQARDVRVWKDWVQKAVAERTKRRMAAELGRDLVAAEQSAAEEWAKEDEEEDEMDGEQ
jgi:hypothetical protein